MTTVDKSTRDVHGHEAFCDHPQRWMVDIATRKVARRACRICAAARLEQELLEQQAAS